MPQSASELSSAMAAGDARAIEAFYREYFDRMYRYARQATRGDEATCLDVVQDAMVRIVRTVRRVESEPQLVAWVRLVVRTTAYDYLKRENRDGGCERVWPSRDRPRFAKRMWMPSSLRGFAVSFQSSIRRS